MAAFSNERLSADRWRIVDEEVARSSGGVVRVRYLRNLRGCRLALLPIAVVPKEALVVGSTTLPAKVAWSAANVSIARVAVSLLEQLASSATASNNGEHQSK